MIVCVYVWLSVCFVRVCEGMRLKEEMNLDFHQIWAILDELNNNKFAYNYFSFELNLFHI